MRLEFITTTLAPCVATDNTYTEQHRGFCHPQTRTAILADIRTWASDMSDDAACFLWLTGDPGSGKSSVTTTVCRELKDNYALWAQFFINRNHTNTINPRFLFPSIALQFANRSSEMALVIYDNLKNQPSLVDDITDAQAEMLFVKPLKLASNSSPLKPFVVVIEALDECDATRLGEMAEVLSKAVGKLPRNVKIFVSSRVEHEIQLHFSCLLDTGRAKHINLDTSATSSLQDVEIILRWEMQKIVKTHRLIQWPAEGQVQRLCEQAAGLFIWAVTAMKFIRAQIKLWGSECLDDVLDQLQAQGMGDINKLYSTILEKTYPIGTDDWLLEVFRRLVGAIVVLNEPLCLAELKALLNLRRPGGHRPVDVEHFFRVFRTVLVGGTDEITIHTFARIHKSFYEFIIGQHAESRFRVDTFMSNAELAPKCLHRFDELVDYKYLRAAVACYEAFITHIPDDDPKKPFHLFSFGAALTHRFTRFSDSADIDRSVVLCENAAGLISDAAPHKPQSLLHLSHSLTQRFKHLGHLSDIDRAIAVCEFAVQLTADSHPDRPQLLSSLGNALSCRFGHVGDLADIDKGVHACEVALQLTPDGHSRKPQFLSNLGNALTSRLEHFGDQADINRAITVCEAAVQFTSDGHFNKPHLLFHLGRCLFNRFARLGNVMDMKGSITACNDAVRLSPDDHPNKAHFLSTLGNVLTCRFKQFGSIADVDQAVQMCQEAVRLTPDHHPDKPHFLNHVGNALTQRFGRHGYFDDRNRAIIVYGTAVELAADDHPEKPQFLSGLGYALSYYWLRPEPSQSQPPLADLAWPRDARSQSHPILGRGSVSPGWRTANRSEYVPDLADIDRAIIACEVAIQLTPDEHPRKPQFLSNLGNALTCRFKYSGDLSDSDRAITTYNVALQLTPDDHPKKPHFLFNLANVFINLDDHSTLDQPILLLSAAARLSTGPPSARFEACSLWAWCARRLQHSSLLDAYTFAIALLPQLAWLGLSMQDRHRELVRAQNVINDAVATAIEFGEYSIAIEWFEQGRSIVWSQVLQLRGSANALREVVPYLADRLLQVSDELAQEAAEEVDSIDASQRRYGLAFEWEELLLEARKIPGFGDFCLPMKASQLMSSALCRPVIALNISSIRCDAIVLGHGQNDILHIPLSEFSFQDAQSWLQYFSHALSSLGRGVRRISVFSTNDVEKVLALLWTHVVNPVLDILDFKHTVCLISTYHV